MLTTDLAGAHSLDIADLDGDGDLDIVSGGWNAGEMRWWQNDEDGVFSEKTVCEDFNGMRYVIARDLDLDGDFDLLSGAQETEVGLRWWENDGVGNFSEHRRSGSVGTQL